MNAVSLAEYLSVLRKRWFTVLICVMVLVGAALGITLTSSKVYQATAQSFVTLADSAQTSTNNDIYQGSQFTVQRVQSYTRLVNSSQVLSPVIDSLKLSTTLPQLAAKVSASSPTNTVLLDVSVTASDPVQAANISNAVAKQLGSVVQTLETPNGTTKSNVRVTLTDPARPPSGPISPRMFLNVALGLLAGLALGIFAAVLREQLDRTVKSGKAVAALTGSRPLGLVPLNSVAGKQPLAALGAQTIHAEAYRTIRTNLQYVHVDRAPRRIVLTSAVENEGKTTIASNLAIALAQGGTRVCVVDADLRRPRIAEYFGVDGTVGLSDVLAGQVNLDEVLVPWHEGLLTVLCAGSSPPDPGALLGSNTMRAVLDDLSERFDVLIIDSPPLLPVADAAVLSRMADGAVLVMRYGKTTVRQVRTMIDSLDTVNATLIGTILSFVPIKRNAYAYDSDYVRRDSTREAAGVESAAPGASSWSDGSLRALAPTRSVPVRTGSSPGGNGHDGSRTSGASDTGATNERPVTPPARRTPLGRRIKPRVAGDVRGPVPETVADHPERPGTRSAVAVQDPDTAVE